MGEDHSIPNPLEKWQKRFKKAVCTVVFLFIFGIVALAVGIALLVKYAEFWNNQDKTVDRYLAYFGLSVLLLGLLLIVIGIIIIVIIVVVKNRVDRSMSQRTFRPPAPGQYGPGKCPYPRQEGWTPQGIVGVSAAAQPPVQAPAPAVQQPAIVDKSAVDADNVHIEVSPSTQF